MTPQAALRRALEEFERRLRSVGRDEWSAATPCSEWDVRALANHVASEARWIAPLLEGKTMAEVGDRLEGDLLGSDPVSAWQSASEEALRVAETEGALDGAVHLSYGDAPADAYLREVTSDITVHTWDLARAVGADESLDAELVEFAADTLEPHADGWRAAGIFADAVDVPADADRQTKLLALLGRRR